jgi:hypothetical protein
MANPDPHPTPNSKRDVNAPRTNRPTPTETLHQSQRGIIYLTEGNNINWELDDSAGSTVAFAKTAAEVRNLCTQLKLTVTDDPTAINRALKMIGSGLALALEAGSAYPADHDFLSEARNFIAKRQREALEFRYLLSAALTALILCGGLGVAVTQPLKDTVAEFLVAAALGGGGAMVSVSQRLTSMPLERYSGTFYTRVAGCTRIVFGCAFGAIFLLLQKAGLLLEVASQNPYFIAAAAFAAGFSERLIPDLLEQFEKHVVLHRGADDHEPRIQDARGARSDSPGQ